VTPLVRWLGPLAVAAAALAASASPAAACLAINWVPDELSDVRGFTFDGVLTSVEGADGIRPRYSFDVKRAYAGDVGRRVVVGSSGSCHGVELVVGERYLFSTSRLDFARAYNAVAWRIEDDGRLSILGFDASASDLYKRGVFAGIDTLKEALRAVAPGSVGELPDTAVAPTSQRPAPGPQFVVAAVIAAIGAAAAFTRRRSASGNVGSS
jgi:hypothetical protein